MGFVVNYIWSSRIGYGIPSRNLINTLIRVSIASAIMCVFVICLKNFYIFALIPLSALLYFALLYIIGGIEKDDMRLLRSVFVAREPMASDENS
jgi:hypothetical protein